MKRKINYTDLLEFLLDLVNSKSKSSNIPSSDKQFLREVVSSLPSSISYLKDIWEGEVMEDKRKDVEDFYLTLFWTLSANIEINSTLEKVKEQKSFLPIGGMFNNIEEKVTTNSIRLEEYMSDGVRWWILEKLGEKVPPEVNTKDCTNLAP